MVRAHPSDTHTDTLVAYTTFFRAVPLRRAGGRRGARPPAAWRGCRPPPTRRRPPRPRRPPRRRARRARRFGTSGGRRPGTLVPGSPLGLLIWCASDLHRHLCALARRGVHLSRSEEHTSELQSLMRISYAVF